MTAILNLLQEGIARVKMFMVITVAYLVFWGPLFLVTLFRSVSSCPTVQYIHMKQT